MSPEKPREKPTPWNLHPEAKRALKDALDGHGVGEHFDAALSAVSGYRGSLPTVNDMRELAKAIKAAASAEKPSAEQIRKIYVGMQEKGRKDDW